jgi:hypothetical protein
VVGETIQEYKTDTNQDNNEPVPEEFNEYEDRPIGDDAQDGNVDAQDGNVDTQTAQTRFCPHCGHTEPDSEARYCRYCGTLLSKSQPSGWINDFFSGEE